MKSNDNPNDSEVNESEEKKDYQFNGGNKTVIRKKTFIEALVRNLGNVTASIEGMGLSRQTFYYWKEQDPEFIRAVNDCSERILDFAESKLFQLMNGVELPDDKVFMFRGKPIIQKMTKKLAPDNSSIIFYLKTKGKARGYVERQETVLSGEVQLPSVSFNRKSRNKDQ